jgi:phage terminase large subunit-like protein
MAALTFGNNGPLPPRNRTMGPTWVRWVHTNCRMGEGDHYGQPAVMTPEQQALFWKLAEIEDDGSRRFGFALLSMGKGSGKSPKLAWVGNIDLAGPAVFKEWAPNGNPRCQPRLSPSVINMASSYPQADLVLDEMRATFEKGPLKSRATSGKGAIQMKDVRGEAKRIPATPKQADGSKASTLLVDEVHELVSENHERAIDVAEGGTGKRADSLIVWGSTAGSDMKTKLGAAIARALRGDFTREELVVYMQADDGLDATNDDDVIKGIKQANPLAARGVANVRQLLAKFRAMPLFRAKRYYWNKWVPADESWLPTGAWDANKGDLVFDPSLPTWVGADMALKRDSAAIVVIQRRADNKLQAFAKIWFPDGGLIDQTECDDYLRSLRDTHNVIWIAADEAWWPTLGTLEAEGLPIFRMPQQGRNMVLAYSQTYRVIVDGILIHDGSPDFSDQIAAAVPNSSDRGWTLKKGKTRRRIDACPALAGGIFATTVPAPEKEKPKPRSQVF